MVRVNLKLEQEFGERKIVLNKEWCGFAADRSHSGAVAGGRRAARVRAAHTSGGEERRIARRAIRRYYDSTRRLSVIY